jgi:hypothetical protein
VTSPEMSARLHAFEEGALDAGQITELFQELVDTGLAWQLQGYYGRIARILINRGLVTAPGEQ